MDDDDIDTSGIPDFSPPVRGSQWALGQPTLVKSIEELRKMFVPVITRETLINQLYVEMLDKSNRNPIARIRAAELIADLMGFRDAGKSDAIPENTDNLTEEEIKLVKDQFEKSY